MKFIHTSDWHIGQTLRNYDRRDEHAHFIRQLCRIIRDEQPDALLVSGDIFDTQQPINAAQTDFVEYALQLREACPGMRIIITAGNHDSGSRLSIHRPIWRKWGIDVIGCCSRTAQGLFDPAELVVEIEGKGVVIAAPFFHPHNYPQAEAGLKADQRQSRFFGALLDYASEAGKGEEPIVMMAHLAVAGTDVSCHRRPEMVGGIKTEEASELGSGYDYLALGHIHKPQTLRSGAGTMRYSGSPMPMSFAEDFEHTVTIAEIEKRGAQAQLREAAIEPLRRVRTIKSADGDFEAAMAELLASDKEDESYARIIVSADAKVPDNCNAAVQKAIEEAGLKLRFFSVEREKAEYSGGGSRESDNTLQVEDVQDISVEAMAKIAYSRRYGSDPTADWVEMLQQAIASVEKAEAEQ